MGRMRRSIFRDPRMTESPISLTAQHPPLLALGFRPFFLAAAASALLLMLLWILELRGVVPSSAYLPGSLRHAHEMLFGYAGAVIAGFLLTAVRNWTGIQTPNGWKLGVLALLWLAIRVAFWLPVPGWLIALLDLAFFPALALGLFKPLWQGKNRVNRVFLLLLAGMTGAGLLVHVQGLGMVADLAPRGLRLMLDLVLLTLLLVSGRVMPFFTRSALLVSQPVQRPWVEWATYGLGVALLPAHLFSLWSPLGGVLLLALALIQGVRFQGWHHPQVWRNPMLAVLYAGYLWLILGLFLDGLANFQWLPPYPALHALTTGAVGVFTLGMMARVTLGHTGREMRASRGTSLLFLLINLAAFIRTLLPLLDPSHYALWLELSAGCWMLAFGLFLAIYGPMLVAPRVDGRPG